MSNELRDKIYDMSNHFLPLDMFYNDIENMAKYPSFNQESAFKDLEKIADFVLDLQSQLAEKDKEIDGIKKQSLENIALLYENATLIENPNDCNMMLSCLNRIKAGTPYIMQEVDVKLEKYDFAVKQLEKVKEKINDCSITDYDTNKHFVKMYQSDAMRQIDNQIKQLKEMK